MDNPDLATVAQWIVGGLVGVFGAGILYVLKAFSTIVLSMGYPLNQIFAGMGVLDSLGAVGGGYMAWKEDQPFLKGAFAGFTASEVVLAALFFISSLTPTQVEDVRRQIEAISGGRLREIPRELIASTHSGYSVK